ncbi:SLC13 family permease [Fictibacillus terranigra]|uniref:SLC13 family permease n=1 Tax=Fictibacillus terranigra TaxID=3058424 RepID=A0ABT8EBY5_9BACL|nr:SLC13 family permease [Fictibacillus sp. CENA-BCM004]MDN4075437.1 SLC13 family permease [Fictibacillus sp. CENA-BCM004]
MSLEIIAILVLLIIFVIGASLPINIGVLGFAAAFIVGTVSGLSIDEIYSVFPVELFIFIVGLTYLFAIIQKSGLVDLMADSGLRLVKGNLGLVPWLIFMLSLILASVGTYGIAVVSLVGPIGLKIAYKYKISPLLMSIMIILGMQAGSFSPLNVFGIIVNGGMQARDLPHSPALLLINCLIYFGLVAMIAFIIFGGLRFFKEKKTTLAFVATSAEVIQTDRDELTEKREGIFNLYKGACLAAIVVLGILSIGFEINIGFAAILVGLVLALIAPGKQEGILKEMPWGVILLVMGIVTYVGVMEKIGVMDYVTGLIADMGNPLLATLAVSYVGGFVSAFASTTGFLASIIPIATPILQDPSLSSNNVISAISASSSIVDLSPLSSAGAILLANVQGIKDRVFFRQLLLTTGVFIALGPGLAWLLFVLIGMPW